jgi:hypothetical protein
VEKVLMTYFWQNPCAPLSTTPPREGNPTATYRYYSYDVWGNERDGYEVNDVFRTPDTYEIPDEGGDDAVFNALKKQGFMRPRVLRRLFELAPGSDENVLYLEYKGRPEGELRREPPIEY